jgi:uncharacterized protein YecE (DUF72 family)
MRLKEAGSKLKDVLSGPRELGKKLEFILVQLPPSLDFNAKVASQFFTQMREIYPARIALEPRHPSWISPEAFDLQESLKLESVAADPPMKGILAPEFPGNSNYYRLHGSPEIYKSNYSDDRLKLMRKKLITPHDRGQERWCIFDNTTFGYATVNALQLQKLLAEAQSTLARVTEKGPPFGDCLQFNLVR